MERRLAAIEQRIKGNKGTVDKEADDVEMLVEAGEVAVPVDLGEMALEADPG